MAAEPSKEAQIEDALSAATPAIRATARVMDEHGNVLKEGAGPYTCFPTIAAVREQGPEPQCLDQVWMEWVDAYMDKKPFKTDRVGVAYMLVGDAGGASNSEPFDMAPTEHNHWVIEGPHVMVIVPDPAQLAGLPTNPDTEGAYVMWPGTDYAHIMIPVAPRPNQRVAGQ
ncbi:MAG TPA: hypothetical protein VNS22_18660 [Geminicoccus sp.]|uniref:hypothetical protein n=1 Tax=Geminicoccus sp. TaxID=2024832 RepID=UPI002CB7387B|nr:hypothetical protein [Geminicoccus sp.]HWL70384.1 hypothetical protein [Geminicoccus sp.]